MSLFVGDNFKYGGRKYLDDRQSFDTLEQMKNFTKVPEGFVTYCKETGKRYEYNSSNTIDELTGLWAEYSVSASGDIFYIGAEAPEDQNDLWFDPGMQGTGSDITINNPLIAELFAYISAVEDKLSAMQEQVACIETMQEQIVKLQEEVEWLKIHGGAGKPVDPENPEDPDEPITSDVFLLLEEGGFFELEEGGFLLSEEVSVVIPSIAVITLEDGGWFELEEGGFLLTEDQPIVKPTQPSIAVITLEDGGFFELENGGFLLTEEQPTITDDNNNNNNENTDDTNKQATILLENGSNLLLENGSLVLLERN